MKQILLVPNIILILMLSGCTVSPSVLGGNIVGIGSGASPDNQISPIINAPNSTSSPDSTGSIVPLVEEGAVVDLPDSSAQAQASAAIQGAPTSSGATDQLAAEDEQAASAQERHRRELINRGDLPEGQPLPVQ